VYKQLVRVKWKQRCEHTSSSNRSGQCPSTVNNQQSVVVHSASSPHSPVYSRHTSARFCPLHHTVCCTSENKTSNCFVFWPCICHPNYY